MMSGHEQGPRVRGLALDLARLSTKGAQPQEFVAAMSIAFAEYVKSSWPEDQWAGVLAAFDKNVKGRFDA